jgi:hypothetical protein
MLDPVALAELPDAAAFDLAMLAALLREIGGDVAFVLGDRGPDAPPALRHLGLTPRPGSTRRGGPPPTRGRSPP